MTPSDGSCDTAAVRWASSPKRLYLSGPVTCTLSDLARAAPTEALELVDPGRKIWMLRGNLFLTEGATLRVHGAPAGGDANVLRLRSDDEGKIEVRAEWGTIDLDGVTVTSWDEAAGGPDTRPEEKGRAFLLARSYLEEDGTTARRSRMIVRRSDVGYLGYDGDESYGLTWRVSERDLDLLDRVDVGGEIVDSRIHDGWFGAYSWGAKDLTITGNEVDHNQIYGLDPHDDSDRLVITDNRVHDNGDHGIICSKRCDHLLIAHNEVFGNGGSGIILHLSATDSTVEGNVLRDNGAAGIALVDSSDNVVRDNQLSGNRRGLMVSNRSHGNRLEGNVVEGHDEHGIYFFPGDDPQASEGRPMENLVRGNTVRGNGIAMVVSEADDNVFEQNTFAGNREGITFQDARSNALAGNDLAPGTVVITRTSSSDRASTLVTSEMPVSVQLVGQATTRFRDAGGRAYAVEGLDEPTVIGADGSTLDLDSSEVGAARTVAPLPLYAGPEGGTVLVTPAFSARAWSARAAAGSVRTTFRLAGLTPDAEQVVRRGGAVLVTTRADGLGVVTFTDDVSAAGSAYSVTAP